MNALRSKTLAVVLAAVVGIPLAVAQAPAQRAPAPTSRQPAKPPVATGTTADSATIKDIEQTFGFVPQFMRAIPDQLLPAFWQGMKTFQMSTETRLDVKTKELIGLAVAAQIPCDYCVMFHRAAALANGASEQELEEAVGMAAMTRQGSTLLNGLQIDKAQFRRDLDRIMRQAKQQARK